MSNKVTRMTRTAAKTAVKTAEIDGVLIPKDLAIQVANIFEVTGKALSTSGTITAANANVSMQIYKKLYDIIYQAYGQKETPAAQ